MFKKDKEREKAAKMIRDEAKKTSTLFLRLSHATNPKVRESFSLSLSLSLFLSPLTHPSLSHGGNVECLLVTLYLFCSVHSSVGAVG